MKKSIKWLAAGVAILVVTPVALFLFAKALNFYAHYLDFLGCMFEIQGDYFC